uniref:Probable salivary secreted peptide n=1 Tax=Cacopsylla melanoneura TaxID=428564 RepID=A0A8D8SWF0_9HEMI
MFRLILSTFLIISVTALPKEYKNIIQQLNNEFQESGAYLDLGDHNSNMIPIKNAHNENFNHDDEIKGEHVGIVGWGHHGVHNLTVGYKTYQDRLLFSGTITKAYNRFRIVETNVVVKSTHGETISYIEAYDLHSSRDVGSAGYASVVSGGTGTRSVTIHLESARNHGLKYYVRVFGHY